MRATRSRRGPLPLTLLVVIVVMTADARIRINEPTFLSDVVTVRASQNTGATLF